MYRFRSGDRAEFHHIVDISFPQLLAIAGGLVQETSLEACEMLHTVMKAFKHAIYVGATLKELRSVIFHGSIAPQYTWLIGHAV